MTVSCPLYVESKQQNEQIEIETDSYIQRKNWWLPEVREWGSTR